MADLTTTFGGNRCTGLTVRVPYAGVWFVDADLDVAVELAGRVVCQIGGLPLFGTVKTTGTFNNRTRCRLLGGNGSWGWPLPAKQYHSDNGVKVAWIVADAAREAGETLGAVEYPTPQLGPDFVRAAGPASRALSLAIGSTPWWVDYDGQTRVGLRPQVAPGPLEVLDYDPRFKVATIATEDPAAVSIGAVVRDTRLPKPLLVKELEISVTPGAVRLRAWGVEL